MKQYNRTGTSFMLSNLYLYRYASLFQALYTWHGVPINVWFTTFYKSIKVPSPPSRGIDFRRADTTRRAWYTGSVMSDAHIRIYNVRASVPSRSFVQPDRVSLNAFRHAHALRGSTVSSLAFPCTPSPTPPYRPTASLQERLNRAPTIFGSTTRGQIGRRDKIIH